MPYTHWRENDFLLGQVQLAQGECWYRDRDLPSFLQKNLISEEDFSSIPVFKLMLDDDEKSIINVDDAGNYRFNADLVNVGVVQLQSQGIA